MMRRAFVAVLGLAFLFGCRGWESEKPPVHLIFNMDTQEKGRPYRADKTGLFADGRVMRLPVEGTVAVGTLHEDDVLEEGLGADGQPSLTFPTSIKREDAFRAHGRLRYEIYCTPCHASVGDGKGPVAGKGLPVPPANFHDPRLKALPVGKIYQAIKYGVNNENMPSYAAQIPVEDRWAIVAHVRQLQKERDPSVAEEGGENIVVAEATTASVEHGAQLYKAKVCVTCHSLDGTRIVGPSFKGLFGKTEATSAGEVTVDEAYLRESITEPNAKVTTGFPPAMPKQEFKPIEVESLILFIKNQK
jgi:mono/diheme cytochrome c family protein